MRDSSVRSSKNHSRTISRVAKRGILLACLGIVATPVVADQNRFGVSNSSPRIVTRAIAQQPAAAAKGIIRVNPFVPSPQASQGGSLVQLASGNQTSIKLRPSGQIGFQPIGGKASPGANGSLIIPAPASTMLPAPAASRNPHVPTVTPMHSTGQIAQPVPVPENAFERHATGMTPNATAGSSSEPPSSDAQTASSLFNTQPLIHSPASKSEGNISVSSAHASDRSHSLIPHPSQAAAPAATNAFETAKPLTPGGLNRPALTPVPTSSTNVFESHVESAPQPSPRSVAVPSIGNQAAAGNSAVVAQALNDASERQAPSIVVPAADTRGADAPVQETQPVFFSFSDNESGDAESETTAAPSETSVSSDDMSEVAVPETAPELTVIDKPAEPSEPADTEASTVAELPAVQSEPTDQLALDGEGELTKESEPSALGAPDAEARETPAATETPGFAMDGEDSSEASASDAVQVAPITAPAETVQVAPEVELHGRAEADNDLLVQSAEPLQWLPVPDGQSDSEQTTPDLVAAPGSEANADSLVVESKPLVLMDAPLGDGSQVEHTPPSPGIIYEDAGQPSTAMGAVQDNPEYTTPSPVQQRVPVAVTTPPIAVAQSPSVASPVKTPVVVSPAVDPVRNQQHNGAGVFAVDESGMQPLLAQGDGATLPELISDGTTRAGQPSPIPAVENSATRGVPASTASYRKSPEARKEIQNITPLRMTRTQVRSLTVGGRLVRVSIGNKDVCQVIASGPNQLKLIGTGNGATELVVWADTESGGVKVKHFEIQVQDAVEATGVALGNKLQLLRQTITRMFPDSNIRIEQNRDHVAINGICPDDRTARQIVRIVRSTCLVPVRDQIRVK